jgi:hypothetical protein
MELSTYWQRIVERCAPSIATGEIGSPHGLDGSLSGHFHGDKNRNRRVRDVNGRPRIPQLARLGRRGAACPRDGPDPRAGRLRIATLVHGTLEGESPEEILTMPNRSISDRTPLYALAVLAVTFVVLALALLALLFFF